MLLIPGAQGNVSAVLLDRIVATVNEEVITWSELMNVILIDGKRHLTGITGDDRDKKIREIERPFLNDLIEMKLQLQQARKFDLDVTESEIDGAIEDIKSKYSLSDEALTNSLSAEGLTMDDYRSRLSDQILLQKVINFSVMNNVVVSDKDIDQYYENHRNEFDTGDKVRISQIFFPMPADSSMKGALEAKAGELVQRIEKGEDFGALAREYSEGPNRQSGGDLGYISRGSVLKEIEDEAFTLEKGEVSRPFWSSAGLHIIKVEDKTGGGGKDNIRSKIRDILQQKVFNQEYREWKAGLREKAYIDIKL